MTIATTRLALAWLSTTARSGRRIPSDFSRASSRRRWRTEATIVRRSEPAAVATPSAMLSGNPPICWKFTICAAGRGGSVYIPRVVRCVPQIARRRLARVSTGPRVDGYRRRMNGEPTATSLALAAVNTAWV